MRERNTTSRTPKETSKEQGLTRRGLLRWSAAVAGGGVFGGTIPLSRDLGGSFPDTLRPPIERDHITINNHQLRVVISEHREEDWLTHRETIEEEIANARIVIPEYYPPEYRHLQQTDNPFYLPVKAYGKRNALFEHIAEVCARDNKSIWVVDPMHNEHGALLQYAINSPTILALIPTFKYLIDLLAQDKNDREKIDRRAVLITSMKTLLSLGAAIGAAEITSGKDDDLRHVVSAELLTQLAATLPQQDDTRDKKPSMTMFIPKAHWDKIKYYLSPEGKQDRQDRLTKYRAIFGKTFPSLFEARYHAPGDTSGNPKETISLLN